MDNIAVNLNKEKQKTQEEKDIRGAIDKQQELHKKIKEQINIQMEKCHLLLKELK